MGKDMCGGLRVDCERKISDFQLLLWRYCVAGTPCDNLIMRYITSAVLRYKRYLWAKWVGIALCLEGIEQSSIYLFYKYENAVVHNLFTLN